MFALSAVGEPSLLLRQPCLPFSCVIRPQAPFDTPSRRIRRKEIRLPFLIRKAATEERLRILYKVVS